ncbi:hypothetical protein TNIN_407751, partial [Trichonephila inaurata madagascariensis]
SNSFQFHADSHHNSADAIPNETIPRLASKLLRNIQLKGICSTLSRPPLKVNRIAVAVDFGCRSRVTIPF